MSDPSPTRASARDVLIVFVVEGIACLGTNLLLLGVYFYTHARLGWTLKQNFLLAAGQGLIGAVGSLLASTISGRFSRRGAALAATYAGMAALSGAMLVETSAATITVLLLCYTLLTSFTWPMLESLVSTGVHHGELSRRIGQYNMVWAGAGALIIAVSGMLIKHAPAAVFAVPLVVHAASTVMILLIREPADVDGGHEVDCEPELLTVRRLALALSRVSLPATYVVIYSLMALLPSLPVIRSLSPTIATIVCSTWMAVRWGTFWALGATVWWHARPRLLLAAAVAMVPAFLGIVLAGLWENNIPTALTCMITAQVLLGICVGVIYSGSLYFGMALSGGSAEHGGYHEALINVGVAVGPIAGVAAEIWRPGDIQTAVAAVTSVVGLSVAATVFTAVVAGRPSGVNRP